MTGDIGGKMDIRQEIASTIMLCLLSPGVPCKKYGSFMANDALTIADEILKVLKGRGYCLVEPEKLTVISDEEVSELCHRLSDAVKTDEDTVPGIIEATWVFVNKLLKAQLTHTIKEIRGEK